MNSLGHGVVFLKSGCKMPQNILKIYLNIKYNDKF